ncbi:hypothetical protein QUS89_22980, partial [Xanthomonas citri pv. citri]
TQQRIKTFVEFYEWLACMLQHVVQINAGESDQLSLWLPIVSPKRSSTMQTGMLFGGSGMRSLKFRRALI